MARLAVTFGGTLDVREGGRWIQLPDKLLTGLIAYQERWPGPVTLVIRAGEDRAGNMGANWHEVAELPFEVAFADDTEEMLRRLAPDVTLLPVNIAHLHMPAGRRVVITAENPALEEYRALRALGVAPSARPRALAGTLRRAIRYRSVVRRAVGVQCNGYPAWDAFARWSPNPLLYFDTRLEARDVAAAREARRPVGSGLRLGFSGRLSEEKGPQYAVEVARLLRAEGLDATLTVYGSGPLERTLAADAHDGVRLVGALPFRPQWVERVPREVDLMVLPHPQGDPAGTYLESAGLGVPFAGFANVALRSLARRHQLGWATPMGDARALARRIVDLAAHPQTIDAAADRGFAFMAEHCFEREFTRRIDHLLGLVRSS